MKSEKERGKKERRKKKSSSWWPPGGGLWRSWAGSHFPLTPRPVVAHPGCPLGVSLREKENLFNFNKTTKGREVRKIKHAYIYNKCIRIKKVERERLKMWKKFWIEIDVKGVREHEEKAEARTHVSVPVPLFLNFLLVFCWMKIERKAKTKESICMNKRGREKRSSSWWPPGGGLWRSWAGSHFPLTPRPVVAHPWSP